MTNITNEPGRNAAEVHATSCPDGYLSRESAVEWIHENAPHISDNDILGITEEAYDDDADYYSLDIIRKIATAIENKRTEAINNIAHLSSQPAEMSRDNAVKYMEKNVPGITDDEVALILEDAASASGKYSIQKVKNQVKYLQTFGRVLNLDDTQYISDSTDTPATSSSIEPDPQTAAPEPVTEPAEDAHAPEVADDQPTTDDLPQKTETKWVLGEDVPAGYDNIDSVRHDGINTADAGKLTYQNVYRYLKHTYPDVDLDVVAKVLSNLFQSSITGTTADYCQLADLAISLSQDHNSDPIEELQYVLEQFCIEHPDAVQECDFSPFETGQHAWDRTQPKRSMIISAELMDESLSDVGNAERFFQEVKGEMMYDTSCDIWRVWNGTAWVEAKELVIQAASNVAKSISNELVKWRKLIDLTEPEHKRLLGDIRNHRRHSCSRMGINAMIELAKTHPGLYLDFKQETDYNLLACRNAVFDQKANKLYFVENRHEIEKAGIKERYGIRFVDRNYEPTKIGRNKPAAFLEQLKTVYTDNSGDYTAEEADRMARQSADAMRRILGYSLVDGNPEKMGLFLWGAGHNGKTTTVHAIENALAGESGTGGLVELCVSPDDKPAPRIAKSISKTIMVFQEIGDGSNDDSVANTITQKNAPVISLTKYKTLTGERDTDMFRGFRQDSEKKHVGCLPIACTNSMPKFSGKLDDATLVRTYIVPHPHRFTAEEQAERAYTIKEELDAEADKIFSLMVDECRKYLEAVNDKKPGLLPMPEHWKTDQARLLAGDLYYAFVTANYIPAEESPGHENDIVTWNETYLKFIEWGKTLEPQYLPSVVYKQIPGEPDRLVLSRAEKMAVNTAFKALHFTEKKTNNGATMNWKAHRLSDDNRR